MANSEETRVDPVPERRLESALETPTGRMLARVATIDQRRPEQPLNFVGSYPGWLTWEPPRLRNFTHYRLRIDQDAGEPDYEIPPGQTALQIFRGRTFFFSTYNAVSRLESPFAVLPYDASADLRAYVLESLQEVEVVANHTMTTSPHPIPLMPAPQPGLRLVVFLTQDSTGGHTPSWDASFKNAPTSDIDPAGNTLSVIDFVYRREEGAPGGDDAWYCVGFQTGLLEL